MNAISEFLKMRNGLEKSTLRNYEGSLGLLLKPDPNNCVHAESVGDVEKAAAKYKMKALKKAAKATKWVQDIVRHTSITFQTERGKNEGTTAYNCGTSVQMMNRHYRNTIDEEKTVTEFWNLTPEKLLKKKPEITLPEMERVAWPDKSALTKLVWQKPLVHAAADIGVSDVALRKHCVKLGIELPTQGHWLRERRP